MSFRAYTASIAYLVLALSAFALSGSTPLIAQELPAVAGAATAEPATPEQAAALTGVASWYGKHWQGRKTASGTRFDISKLTAANRDLPLNTRVRVTNLLNGLSVVVLVNDRGPYVGERVMDLSEAAAKRLGMIKSGLAPVRIETITTQAA
ncbi:MAG TPA: septal ring lytic transglycosylase RlpA family protein [Stellaceae bacterium]|jgi:rare lipoprotein A